MGKSIGWESLQAAYLYEDLPTMFPSVADVSGGLTTRFVSLIPANVTRGVVTLERMKIMTSYYWSVLALDSANEGDNIPLAMNIQLVGVQDGAIALDSVLSPRNAADQESNRVIWRHTFWPDLSDAAGAVIDTIRVYQSQGTEFDVKSKRRFDRANWALIYVCQYPTIPEIQVRGFLDIRALFRTADGI